MGLIFFLKLCFIFSFLFCSHATVFDEIAASHRGLRLSEGIIFHRKLKTFGFVRPAALFLHCCTALRSSSLCHKHGHAHNCFAGFFSFLLLLHELNLVQEMHFLALAVALTVLVPSGWCTARKLLTSASSQLSRLASASTASPHKSSIFLLELPLPSTIS